MKRIPFVRTNARPLINTVNLKPRKSDPDPLAGHITVSSSPHSGQCDLGKHGHPAMGDSAFLSLSAIKQRPAGQRMGHAFEVDFLEPHFLNEKDINLVFFRLRNEFPAAGAEPIQIALPNF